MELTISETVQRRYVIDDPDVLLRAGVIPNPEHLEERDVDDLLEALEDAGVEPCEWSVQERELSSLVIACPAPIYAVMNIPCTLVHAVPTTLAEAEMISAGLKHSFVHTLTPQESLNLTALDTDG